MTEVYELLKKELQKNGFTVRTVSVEHVEELKKEMAGLREQSLLDGQFYDRHLSWMDFEWKGAMPGVRSIIVVSRPQYTTLLNFAYKGKSCSVPLPPTYVYGKMRSLVEKSLSGVLSPYGYSISRTRLPAKLLAVRTGLGVYGRNNICYVKGTGSFHRLFAYYSDMPPAEDDWQEVKVMPECGKCEACVRACPTKCIDGERFLIHADKCITVYNENEGDFPGWFDRSWHNAIVGCMKCQWACPQNREFAAKAEDEVGFTAGETELILENGPLDSLPPSLKQKLDDLDLTEYYGILGRNLAVLIGANAGLV